MRALPSFERLRYALAGIFLRKFAEPGDWWLENRGMDGEFWRVNDPYYVSFRQPQIEYLE